MKALLGAILLIPWGFVFLLVFVKKFPKGEQMEGQVKEQPPYCLCARCVAERIERNRA